VTKRLDLPFNIPTGPTRANSSDHVKCCNSLNPSPLSPPSGLSPLRFSKSYGSTVPTTTDTVSWKKTIAVSITPWLISF